MEQCQSLKTLTLKCLEMDENHCRLLGAYSRPGLEIELLGCNLTSVGTSALAESLGRNQGPTKLDRCIIDYSVLADGLRGNSRLKSLRPRFSDDRGVGDQELLAIAGALKENKGLIDLNLTCRHAYGMSYDWGAVCDSLKTHPTLEVLNLSSAYPYATITPAVLKSRMQTLLDMVKVNLSIHNIQLDYRYSQHEIFRESVVPYLETNRFRSRIRAIQKTRPIPYRAYKSSS
jgi:hypothetical protein